MHTKRKKDDTIKRLVDQLDELMKRKEIPDEIKKMAYEKLRESITALQELKEPNMATSDEMLLIKANISDIMKIMPSIKETPIALPE